MKLRKKFAILNDCDQPARSRVCQRIRNKFYYMARADDESLKQYDGIKSDEATYLEDFGFEIFENDTHICFARTWQSVATYPDGKPRYWQGESVFSLPKVRL